MTRGIDSAQRMAKAALAALVVLALVIPACMTVACFDMGMSGSGAMSSGSHLGAMGTMVLSDCVSTIVSHGGLAGLEAQVMEALFALVALLGIAIAALRVAAPVPAGWVAIHAAVAPAPPLDPRGERLLI